MRKSNRIWFQFLISFIIIGVLFLLPDVHSAQACSGGRRIPLDDLADEAEVVVKAYPIEMDTLGQNGIIKVESYLKGKGVEYLLLVQTGISEAIALREDLWGSGGCNSMGKDLSDTDQTVYLFLQRGTDGAYRTLYSTLSESSVYRFTDDQTVSVSFHTTKDLLLTLEFTETQFVDYLAERINHPAQQPHPQPTHTFIYGGEWPDETVIIMPRTAPLIITTQNGTHYLLPVDVPTLFPLPDAEVLWYLRNPRCFITELTCTAYSPDGTRMVQVVPDTGFNINQRDLVPGQAILFSASSETFVVWHDRKLELYAMRYPYYGYDDWTPTLINSTPVQGSPDLKTAVWTPNGRYLAYRDDEGLKIWDVFAPSQTPRLLIQAAPINEASLLCFSSSGRYLAIVETNQRYTLDLYTNERLPFGVVSPDERTLITPQIAGNGVQYPRLCFLGAHRCTPGEVNPDVQAEGLKWINNREYLYFIPTKDGTPATVIHTGSVVQRISGKLI